MKKILIVLGAVVAFVLVLLVALNLFGPGIARRYLEKNSKELIGRQLRIQKVGLNVFTGKVEVVGFKMMEANDKDVFASFDSLEVRVRLRKLFGRELYLKRIAISNPKVVILQNGSKFNFDDLIKKDTAKADTTKKTPFKFALNNVQIKSGMIYYKDVPIDGVWELQNLDLFIPSVYFGGRNTDVGLEFNFGTGGYFRSKNEYNIETGRYLLGVTIKDFDVKSALPYAKKYLKISSLKGLVSCDLKINGDANHVTNFSLSGDASLRGFGLKNLKDEQIVNIDSLFVGIQNIDSQKNIFNLSEVALNGASVNIDLLKNGNSISQILVPQKPEPTKAVDTASSKPMLLEISKVAISGVDVSIADKTLHRPFIYKLSDINVSIDNFNPDKANKINVTASLPGGGKTTASYNGDLKNISNLVFNLKVNNLDLKYLSPYVEQYTGFPIVDGALSFSSDNTIKNYNIDADNKLDIVKVSAGKKLKSFKPEYKVPLKTALYIIQDREGKASFDVPVTGNIKSPQFSYKKIVIKTIVNLLVKVAVAPVDFIGKELGIKNDIPAEIVMNVEQSSLTTEQHVVLGDIAKIMTAKPELKLSLLQSYDSLKVMEQVAMLMAKTDFYVHQNNLEGKALTESRMEQVEKISLSNPIFRSYVDSLSDTIPESV